VGVIETPRVQLGNGLFRTKETPTSLPTAAIEYPRCRNAESFIQGGSAAGRCGTRKKIEGPRIEKSQNSAIFIHGGSAARPVAN
jgi:hypothetical protein